jgi:prepilin-type N-terminal cleavage/methylation domain-containing protein
MKTTDRRGFTLTELVVVTVLGALVVAASLQILITNQRTYTAQTAQIQGQQNTRAALDILTAEIREISPAGGDLLYLGPTVMWVRAMRKLGIACDVSLGGTPTLRLVRIGDAFTPKDSVFVFADNRENIRTDDTWISAQVSQVDTAVACGADRAVTVSFAGQGSLFAADSVRVGASVRSYVHYVYGLYGLPDGQRYLARWERAGTSWSGPTPIVGPLKSTNGLQFTYLDGDGNTTSVGTDVRQVAVRVRTHSVVMNSIGEPVSDSISALIYTRN